MRSIRLSLVIYFLVLLAVALGAVSWFVYKKTESTLQVAAHHQETFLRTEYIQRCQEADDNLDRRILRQAHTLAGLARSTRTNLESLFPLGALSSPMQAQGYLTMPLWFAEAYYAPLAIRLYWIQPPHVHIHSAEDVVGGKRTQPSELASLIGSATALPLCPINAAASLFPQRPFDDHPVEYFQTFSRRGSPLLRSKNLCADSFTLNEDLRDNAKFLKGYFDTIEIRHGVEVRRVTVKAQVRSHRYSHFPQPWLWKGKGKPSGPNAGGKKPSGPPPFRARSYERRLPTIFIQYASDRSHLVRTLQSFREDLDSQLASRRASDKAELARLRLQLFWIAIATFAAVVCGGLLLVHFGLAPLRRLSVAVSRISEKDFRLQLDEKRLPIELQPIADGMTASLLKLERAFDREKQAAADISHELRTPLAALMTTLDVTLRKQRTVAEYCEVLEDCRLSGKQMTTLVERLLALARLDAGVDNIRPQSVDVTELAKQCAAVVRPLAEARGLMLRIHLGEALPLVADPEKIREILNNLLHNAIQYNKPDGEIDLSVQRINGSVAMAVRDSGIGIAPENREKIFQRFYRVDPSRHADEPHAGLGLSIVKGYVDLLGGTIDVMSSDKGTTFQVELPANENLRTPAG